MSKCYEKFKEVLDSEKTMRMYDSSNFKDEIVSFQMYGFSEEQVESFWRKYKRERSKNPNYHRNFRFSCRSAAMFKA